MFEYIIRTANVDDAQPIADFHVKVWRHTYRVLAPPEAYVILDEGYRGEKWKQILSSDDEDHIVLIVEAEGKILGIGAAGRPSEGAFEGRGEIKFLYVDPDVKRRGIGRELLKRLGSHLRERQFPGAALSVVKGNGPAIAFYEALNGRPAGEYTDPGPVWRSRNIVFVWDDTAELIGR